MKHQVFSDTIWQYYKTNKRKMPWRKLPADPYEILVSEVMLQQTQVSRVISKYEQFLDDFPTVKSLADASLGSVLKVWSGLGYNRRAKYLWEAAKGIVSEYGGQFPDSSDELVKLPGIGKNTAGAIMAYAFNEPVVFIETNIRSVYLHHFFADETDVPDSKLLPLIEATLDITNPREWYWALMDYGSYLKTMHQNPSQKSKHHTKQSAFAGSKRQLRGWVLKQLAQKSYSLDEMLRKTNDKRLEIVLSDLLHEGLIHRSAGKFKL